MILLVGVLVALGTHHAWVTRFGIWFRALDAAVLVIVVAEITPKIVTHGRRPLDDFRDGWNAFDSLAVGFCQGPGPGTGSLGAVLRLACVFRLLRPVTVLPKLQLLIEPLLTSLSATGCVSLLLSLPFYIDTVPGVHLLERVDEDLGSLGAALLTSFRIVTLDNWGDTFTRAATVARVLKLAISYDPFTVFGTMTILNLFLGIIVSDMTETHAEIEERDRRQHIQETGSATRDDTLARLEREPQSLQAKIDHLRRQTSEREEKRQP